MKYRNIVITFLTGFILGGLILYFLTKKENEVTAEISHNMIVEKVEALGRLEVTKYNIQDVMEYKKIRQWLPNSKTALIVVGEVIGCVDLAKVKPEDIYASKDTVSIILPAPEVCHVRVDHSLSRIHNIEFGLWESEKIADEAYYYAEKKLKERALNMNIESESRNNAVKILHPILEAMGFKKIRISFRSADERINERQIATPAH